MRSIIIFIFVCIAGLDAVTGYTENSISKQSSEVIAAKRKECNFLSDAEFENIVDKPCIVYRGGGGSLWSIVFRDTATFGVYYFDSADRDKKANVNRRNSNALKKKLHSPKCTFDTAVFFERYSSLINWGLDELPETISKEKLKKRKYVAFHNPSLHVFTRDSIYYIPLSFEYEFKHKEVESKVNELFVMMFRLTANYNEKSNLIN